LQERRPKKTINAKIGTRIHGQAVLRRSEAIQRP